MRFFIQSIVTVAGLGNFPYAPGTLGSLVGVGIAYFFPTWITGISLTLFFCGGWAATHHVLSLEKFKDPDPSSIIIDEVFGILLVIFLVSLFSDSFGKGNFCSEKYLLLELLLFRFFDIVKPWPIGKIDFLLSQSPRTAALGVMLDDGVAGIMAAILTILFITLS